MESSTFDELTRVLASSTSRRQVLKTITAATLGGMLGLGGISVALANNSACAHFCASVFGADTPAAGQCTSDAAHHKGLCYSCGPASPAGTQTICCSENSSGQCTSYSSATCCSGVQTCQNGGCCTPDGANSGQTNACTQNSDCCSGFCNSAGFCGCIPFLGEGCNSSSDCCGGIECVPGLAGNNVCF